MPRVETRPKIPWAILHQSQSKRAPRPVPLYDRGTRGANYRWANDQFPNVRARELEEMLAAIAPQRGQTIFEYSASAQGAQDYQILIERVLNHDDRQ